MLDDLRNNSDFVDEEPGVPEEDIAQPTERQLRRRARGPFLGMTPQQRFILALMLFMMVCVLGVAVLVLTESVYLPFL